MVRKFVTATVSAALCAATMAPAAAAAQEYRFAGFDGPRGATATVNLRVPFGQQQQRAERPTFGLSFGYGRVVGAGLDGWANTRAVNVADIRFTERGELRNARLASFDLAHLDEDRRLNMVGGGKKSLLIIGGIIVAGVLICVAADCFGDDDEDEDATPGN
jgi:hypothetical protein